MVKVKICGLKRSEDIQIVNHLRPDFAGFVFAKSKRQVDEKTAETLRKELSNEIPAVGVFVNEDREKIRYLCEKGIIQIIQLHGDENAEYIAELKKMLPEIPIIKAVRVRTAKEILEAEKQECDYLLLDTYVKDVYGGSGKVFDKKLIPVLKKPYFLAGGLNAENVNENIEACNPFAVDVSSAVEKDGIKDEIKIKEFLERVRENE